MPKKERLTSPSKCPINYTLEIIGNRWAFLILRDIVYYGKHTYNEFLASDEHVTTSMLADRLAKMEHDGIVQKTRSQVDRRKEVYSLTDKGLAMIPVLVELSSWGEQYDTDTNIDGKLAHYLEKDRTTVLQLIRQTVKTGGSVFVGEGNVMQQLEG